jgi:hypothetical protein
MVRREWERFWRSVSQDGPSEEEEEEEARSKKQEAKGSWGNTFAMFTCGVR